MEVQINDCAVDAILRERLQSSLDVADGAHHLHAVADNPLRENKGKVDKAKGSAHKVAGDVKDAGRDLMDD